MQFLTKISISNRRPHNAQFQKWIGSQLEAAPKDDPYWGAVNRTYYQISGLSTFFVIIWRSILKFILR